MWTCSGPGAGAEGDRVAARHDDVVAAEVELLDRQRHERREVPEVRGRSRDALDERRAQLEAVEPTAVLRLEVLDDAVERRGRQHVDHLGEHLLRAAPRDEPVVDEGGAVGHQYAPVPASTATGVRTRMRRSFPSEGSAR